MAMTGFDGAVATTRRRVLHLLALLGFGGPALARAASTPSTSSDQGATTWPAMPLRTLGRTGFRGSRLVFGCGAALMRQRRDVLLAEEFEH
jgi:hypothetical protein